MSDYRLVILERVGFDECGRAISWMRSLDGGKTWTPVEWLGAELPFIGFNVAGQSLTREIWEARSKEGDDAVKE